MDASTDAFVSELDRMVLISHCLREISERYHEIGYELVNILGTASVDFFFRNSTRKSMEWFLERARGTFGIAVSSTVRSDEAVFAAFGQPKFCDSGMEESRTGFDTVLYGSEVHALHIPILGPDGNGRPQQL
ncbi:hypothetical protein FVE85_5213 [Porphyridium purpureum]|uniref:Uncharacterized protein n=1 Tax=Porphyridium purpureum TaxID=35688 RepID=A0A5J4Z309_PORPP|nr:hypothetical protein FVE85_5213 [Porphyridium purpureum]|eukprot:POR3695..scf295_1